MTEPIENPLSQTPGSDAVSPVRMPPLAPGQEIPEEAPTRSFAPYMEQQGAKPGAVPSPMELAGYERERAGAAAEVNPESLNQGIKNLGQKVGGLKDELTPGRFGQLTDAQKILLNEKLGQFGQSVKGLSQRLGTPVQLPPAPKGVLSDVKTMLDWLTQGQQQLETVGQNMAKMPPGQISVVAMLRAQAQLLAADRAINFSTAIVSKGADFINKIMQTQL